MALEREPLFITTISCDYSRALECSLCMPLYRWISHVPLCSNFPFHYGIIIIIIISPILLLSHTQGKSPATYLNPE